MSPSLLSILMVQTLVLAEPGTSVTSPRPRDPARARLCASVLESKAGQSLSGKPLHAEIETATARVKEIQANSSYPVGPNFFGTVRKIFRIFTAPFLGDRPVIVPDVTRPDEGLARRQAVGQLALATQVADALTLITSRDHLYSRLTLGRAAIVEKLTGILDATLSKETLHQLMVRAKVPRREHSATIDVGADARPDLPLWGRVLGLGTAVGLSAGAGYLAGAQIAAPIWSAVTGAATFAATLSGWIVIRDSALDFGHHTLLKVQVWRQRLRERGQRRESERRESLIERAEAQVETLSDLIALVADGERKNTFVFYGFDTELPLDRLDRDPALAAASIEAALANSPTRVSGPRVHVRVEFVLYFDGEEPKLLTFVNPVENPYLHIPRYPDMIGLGIAI